MLIVSTAVHCPEVMLELESIRFPLFADLNLSNRVVSCFASQTFEASQHFMQFMKERNFVSTSNSLKVEARKKAPENGLINSSESSALNSLVAWKFCRTHSEPVFHFSRKQFRLPLAADTCACYGVKLS